MFSFTGVPEGYDDIRINARNRCGTSLPSNVFRVHSYDS